MVCTPHDRHNLRGNRHGEEASEHFAESHGVHIQHYLCDNCFFAGNVFIADCEQNKQYITYCGVNAHFQNGIVEQAIRGIQEQALNQLLHAWARWPDVIHLAL